MRLYTLVGFGVIDLDEIQGVGEYRPIWHIHQCDHVNFSAHLKGNSVIEARPTSDDLGFYTATEENLEEFNRRVDTVRNELICAWGDV